MGSFDARTAAVYGRETLALLRKKAVIVFGIGGVGGFVVEALARCGVGRLGLVDFDVVSPSNLNRQIIALRSTLGQSKVRLMAERVAEIDPEILVEEFPLRLTAETLDAFRLEGWDYCADAIDDVPAKLLLIRRCKELGVPILACMGTGKKKDPMGFRVADISKTHSCPLARAMRRELGKAGIKDVKVVFSPELPHEEERPAEGPGSVIFGPAAAGLLMAARIIEDLRAEGGANG